MSESSGWKKVYVNRTWRVDGVGTKARARCWARGEETEDYGAGVVATVRVVEDDYVFEGEHYTGMPHEVLVELWKRVYP